MQGYHNDIVADLAKQLTAGLLRLRRAYVDSAEDLICLIKPDQDYPYEFVLFRMTGFRSPKPRPIDPLAGEGLRADLQNLILELCDSFDLPAAAYDQPAQDITALARRLRVSTKTVQRWRGSGLVARKLTFADGKKRVAFLESSVRAFARGRGRMILRSARFSQLSGAQRQEIVAAARELVAQDGCCLHEVSRVLAERTGRAIETIRYTIRRYDRANPAKAVFSGSGGPISDSARAEIYEEFLRGVSVTALAQRYDRARGSIYRLINESRAQQLLHRKIDYVYNPQFDLPSADELILAADACGTPALGRGDCTAEGPDVRRDATPPRPPVDLPPYLQSLYQVPLLSPAQERLAFQRYNYLKFRADALRRSLDAHTASGQLRQVERLLVQAEAAKNRITRANLRLVVSIARKHVSTAQDLFELISDGNLSLMRAVEKFDYARGFKFSTYASWAIIKGFARSVPRERYLLDRFATGLEASVLELPTASGPVSATEMADLRESLQVVLGQLTPRERSIVTSHFGLTATGQPQTLEQLSRQLGLSKERVRQIERVAMDKLRTMLQPNRLELLGNG